MMLADLFFIGVCGITLLGAVLAVSLRNVFYNAMGLVLCLFGVAGLFIFLNSEFLAVMEVIIYIGAISIAIIFAIMLSSPMIRTHERLSVQKTFRSLVVAGAVGFGLWKAIQLADWPAPGIEGDYSIQAIGRSLLTDAILPFEAVSLVLLVAIIGALVLSQKERA